MRLERAHEIQERAQEGALEETRGKDPKRTQESLEWARESLAPSKILLATVPSLTTVAISEMAPAGWGCGIQRNIQKLLHISLQRPSILLDLEEVVFCPVHLSVLLGSTVTVVWLRNTPDKAAYGKNLI